MSMYIYQEVMMDALNHFLESWLYQNKVFFIFNRELQLKRQYLYIQCVQMQESKATATDPAWINGLPVLEIDGVSYSQSIAQVNVMLG